MALNPFVEDGIKGAEELGKGAGAAIRTWANANLSKLPPNTALTIPAPITDAAVIRRLRGVLLAYQAFGRHPNSVVPTFREIIKTWAAAELTAELKAYYEFSTAPKKGVLLMPSFRHATSGNRENAKSTLTAASVAMMKAYLAAYTGKQGAGPERTRMETWFGAFDGTRYGTVVANLKKLSDVLGSKPICVYYRGTNLKGPSDEAGENKAAPKETAFAAAWRTEDMPADLKRAFSTTFSHVVLGEKFFNYKGKRTGVASNIAARVAMFGPVRTGLTRPTETYASTTGSDSVAGVLVHELSHNICNTDDVELPSPSPNAGEDCYGQENCKWLAQHVPAGAIKNADTYEYYFEEFQ